MENPSLTIKQLIFINVFFICYWFVFCKAHYYSLFEYNLPSPLLGLSDLFKLPKDRNRCKFWPYPFSSPTGNTHYWAMSIFKCKWPSKLGQSSFLEPLLNHHLCVFLFKAGLLSPYASPPVFYLTIFFSFAREIGNYVLLILSKSSLMTILASRGSVYSADVFIKQKINHGSPSCFVLYFWE